MSDFEDTTEIVTEVAEEVAQVSTGFLNRDFGMFLGGFIVGAGIGAVAFVLTKRRMETKYSKLAAEEIADMREHYLAKTVALENTVDKPKLDALVREQGYFPMEEPSDEEPVGPPMAVTPPTAVVEAAEEAREDDPKPSPPPAPLVEEVRNVFQDQITPDENWDWHKERSQRSPLQPYVIHREEREEQDAYDGVTFTYYEEDDVVCNEIDEVIDESDRARIIGEANLEKFGHGSGDASVVYIRNDKLEMDLEVVLSPNSYAEEVHGFEPEIRHTNRFPRWEAFDDE